MSILKTEELCFGDVVWATVPVSEEELNEMKECNRIRPYLISKIENGTIYVFKVWNKKPNILNNYEWYELVGYYKMYWVDLRHLIELPADNLVNKVFHLNNIDLGAVQKRLKIQSNRDKISECTSMTFELAKGDVIQYSNPNNTLYYIINVTKTQLACYPISYQFRNHWVKIKINSQNFYINFKDKMYIPIAEKVKIFDMANKQEINFIDAKKARMPKKVKKTETVKQPIEYEVGSVFNTIYGKVLYLYKSNNIHYGVNLSTYKMNPRLIHITDLVDSCGVVEVYGEDKVGEIVRFLYDYIPQPHQRFVDLFNKTI